MGNAQLCYAELDVAEPYGIEDNESQVRGDELDTA